MGHRAAAPATQATKPIAANGSASSSGLKISPVRSDITVNAGSTQIVPVTVENVTSQVASYKVVINDFTAATDETGQPQIILDSNQFAQSHSLKRLVGDIPNVTLSPGQTANINVPVTVPKDYKAGGYYGAVRFVPASSDNAASKNVTLSASVGSLILVTVPGDIREALSVASLDVRKIVGPNQIDAPAPFLAVLTSSRLPSASKTPGISKSSPLAKSSCRPGAVKSLPTTKSTMKPRAVTCCQAVFVSLIFRSPPSWAKLVPTNLLATLATAPTGR